MLKRLSQDQPKTAEKWNRQGGMRSRGRSARFLLFPDKQQRAALIGSSLGFGWAPGELPATTLRRSGRLRSLMAARAGGTGRARCRNKQQYQADD